MIHIYQGFCPDDLQPDSRDPNCPACQVEAERDALRAENARLTAAHEAAADELARVVQELRAARELIREAQDRLLKQDAYIAMIEGRE